MGTALRTFQFGNWLVEPHLKVIKAQVYRHLNMELGDAMKETNEWMTESLVREDFKEGVSSFMEKRLPEFKRVGEE